MTSSKRSLYRLIKDQIGLDVRKCQACMDCECNCPEEQDVPLGSLIQLIALNDEEILTCRTLWSDAVLEVARNACKHGLDLYKIIQILRQEAINRGLVPKQT